MHRRVASTDAPRKRKRSIIDESGTLVSPKKQKIDLPYPSGSGSDSGSESGSGEGLGCFDIGTNVNVYATRSPDFDAIVSMGKGIVGHRQGEWPTKDFTAARTSKATEKKTKILYQSAYVADAIAPEKDKNTLPVKAPDTLTTALKERMEAFGDAPRLRSTMLVDPGLGTWRKGATQARVIGEREKTAYNTRRDAALYCRANMAYNFLLTKKPVDESASPTAYGRGQSKEKVCDTPSLAVAKFWDRQVRASDYAGVDDMQPYGPAPMDDPSTSTMAALTHAPDDPEAGVRANFRTPLITMEHVAFSLMPPHDAFRECVNGPQCAFTERVKEGGFNIPMGAGTATPIGMEFYLPQRRAEIEAAVARGEDPAHPETHAACFMCIVLLCNRVYGIAMASKDADTAIARTFNPFRVLAGVSGGYAKSACISVDHGPRYGIIGNFPIYNKADYVRTLLQRRDRVTGEERTLVVLNLRKECLFDYASASLVGCGIPPLYPFMTTVVHYVPEPIGARASRFWATQKQDIVPLSVSQWASRPLADCARGLRAALLDIARSQPQHSADSLSEEEFRVSPEYAAEKAPPEIVDFFTPRGLSNHLTCSAVYKAMEGTEHRLGYEKDPRERAARSLFASAVLRAFVYDHLSSQRKIDSEDNRRMVWTFRDRCMEQLAWFLDTRVANGNVVPIDVDVPAHILESPLPMSSHKSCGYDDVTQTTLITSDPSVAVRHLGRKRVGFDPAKHHALLSRLWPTLANDMWDTVEVLTAAESELSGLVRYLRESRAWGADDQALAAGSVPAIAVVARVHALEAMMACSRMREKRKNKKLTVHVQRVLSAHVPWAIHLLQSAGSGTEVSSEKVIYQQGHHGNDARLMLPVAASLWAGDLPNVSNYVEHVGLLGTCFTFENAWAKRGFLDANAVLKRYRHDQDAHKRAIRAATTEAKKEANAYRNRAIGKLRKAAKVAAPPPSARSRGKGKNPKRARPKAKTGKGGVSPKDMDRVNRKHAALLKSLTEEKCLALELPASNAYNSTLVDGTNGLVYWGAHGFGPTRVRKIDPTTIVPGVTKVAPTGGATRKVGKAATTDETKRAAWHGDLPPATMDLSNRMPAFVSEIMELFSYLIPRRGCGYDALENLCPHLMPGRAPHLLPFFATAMELCVCGAYPWVDMPLLFAPRVQVANVAPGRTRVLEDSIFGSERLYGTFPALTLVALRQAFLFIMMQNKGYCEAVGRAVPEFTSFVKSTTSAGNLVATMGNMGASISTINETLLTDIAYAPLRPGTEGPGRIAVTPVPSTGVSRAEGIRHILAKAKSMRESYVRKAMGSMLTLRTKAKAAAESGKGAEAANKALAAAEAKARMTVDIGAFIESPAWERMVGIVETMVPGILPHPYVVAACTRRCATPADVRAATAAYAVVVATANGEKPLLDGVRAIADLSNEAYFTVRGLLYALAAHATVTATEIADVDIVREQRVALKWRHHSLATQSRKVAERRPVSISRIPRMDDGLAAGTASTLPSEIGFTIKRPLSAPGKNAVATEMRVPDTLPENTELFIARPCCRVFSSFIASLPGTKGNNYNSFGNIFAQETYNGSITCHDGSAFKKKQQAQKNRTLNTPCEKPHPVGKPKTGGPRRKPLIGTIPWRSPDVYCGDLPVEAVPMVGRIVHCTGYRQRRDAGMGDISIAYAECGRMARVDAMTIEPNGKIECNACDRPFTSKHGFKPVKVLCCVCMRAPQTIQQQQLITFVDDEGDYSAKSGYACTNCLIEIRDFATSLCDMGAFIDVDRALTDTDGLVLSSSTLHMCKRKAASAMHKDTIVRLRDVNALV